MPSAAGCCSQEKNTCGPDVRTQCVNTQPCWTFLTGVEYQDIQDGIMAKVAEQRNSLKANKQWECIGYRVRRDELYRRFQKEKEEKLMQECLCKAEKDKCDRERRITEEEKCIEQMQDCKEEEIREAAFRKQLYACAPEIRDLERQLRRGYYAKTLYAQRLEREARDIEEKMRQDEMHELFKEALRTFDEKEEEKEKQRMKMKCDYKEQLQHQLTDASSKAAQDKAGLERDKQMVDEILATIKQEEIDDLVEKVNKVKLYQSEINNFLEARENQRQREKERQQQEQERDSKYLSNKEEQKAAYNQAKADRDKAKAAIIAKAVEQMMQAQFQAEELEELRQEFYEAETAENERRKEAEEEAKRCRTIKELRAAEADAKRMLAEKLAAEKEEEEKFKLQLLAKFAEDDRLEQMGNTKRRQREREHRLKVEEMIIERRAQRAQEREKQLAARQCEEEEEKRRQEVIDSERQKLLREHGPKLLGFIPRGTIKSQKELDQLGAPILAYYRDGKQFREPDPSTIDFSECEEELFKNMELPKHIKY